MDGNGRWAKKRLLPRSSGHRAGVEAMHRIVKGCISLGIPYITTYAFSTENKKRPKAEVNALMGLIKDSFSSFLDDMLKNDMRITTMGDLSYFPEDLQEIFNESVSKSANGKRGALNIALNYGSRDEILRAVNEAVKRGNEVDYEQFARLLYTCDMPDPDLIVRTGGEKRLSNFMLYQSAYSEFYFSDTLWPDFNTEELGKILENYSARERRFGKVK